MEGGARIDAEPLPGEIFLDAGHAELAAEAREMAAAERRLDMADVVRVHPDVRDVEPAREPERAVDVLRPDRAAQPIRRIVGDGERFLLVAAAMDDQHGSEHLLARDA